MEKTVEFNNKPCKNGCNCVEVAEGLNGGNPVKGGYPCLERTPEKVEKLKNFILDADTEEVLEKLIDKFSVCAKCGGIGVIKGGPTDSRKDQPCSCQSEQPAKDRPFDGSVQFDLDLGDRRIRVNCPDDDNDIYIHIKREKQYAGISLSLYQAEELANYILGHVKNAREANP